MKKQRTKTQIFSRVVGFYRPTDSFNEGKLSEYKDRVMFRVNKNKNGKQNKQL